MESVEDIRESASRRGVPIIREESHNLLKELVARIKPQNILEIGTAVGYSGIVMLSACDSSTLLTIEHNKDSVCEAVKNFSDAGFKNRAEVVCDDCVSRVSLMALNEKYYKHFDLVFLDGPKAQYVKMLESLIMLTKSKGTIIADNVLFRGYVFGDKSNMPKRYKTIVKRLEMFINTVKTHPDIESYKLYNIEDGLMEIKIK